MKGAVQKIETGREIMTEKNLKKTREEVIVDASGTKHEVKVVENNQALDLPRPCKCCGRKIATGWNDIEGYCRKCWKAIRKNLRPLECFEKK